MKTSLFYLPSVGSKSEMEQGMVGLRPKLYQQMLHELSEQAKLADDAGYDSISFTEHHFHVEGFEVSNNPVMLDPDTGENTLAQGDFMNMGYALVGSVDTVWRQMEGLLTRLPARWLFAWAYNGLIPHAKLMKSLKLYATKVMPRFAE